ncbi:hypothetical protein [Microcoleus sp. bin38.metabat.b11b12b14.051]|uniref:hypothetical protein n=1 Tax=Microcoleus sp. bin38.metabat.b11b12b14.051 TaxID=2742709 RepID=UPI0025EE5D02|nr:hypothetical protein [Microcoleus sp. bin38.metabat.b11b12b14.051]
MKPSLTSIARTFVVRTSVRSQAADCIRKKARRSLKGQSQNSPLYHVRSIARAHVRS